VTADHLVNALGRRPAVDALGLEAAHVDVRRGGHVVVDPLQRTSNPRIFAAGDVCGPFEIVHLAIMQGEVAARAAAGIATQPVRMDNRTAVTFTDPQVAAAGIPLSECIASGIDPQVADYPFADHGKSLLMEAPHGYVKVWADPSSGRVLGAECVGKDAGELIHSMAVAITLRATAADLLGVHWYHPTLSEIWSYPLEELVIA
jgi:pyruvate/2-oxoglutarate dehydrogenase complex dihydrolipoamide dehydrogenase (E3) component